MTAQPGYQPVSAAAVVEAHRPRTGRRDSTGCRAWVEQIYRPGYGQIAATLPACWEQHTLCLYTLDWLSELWSVPLPRPRARPPPPSPPRPNGRPGCCPQPPSRWPSTPPDAPTPATPLAASHPRLAGPRRHPADDEREDRDAAPDYLAD